MKSYPNCQLCLSLAESSIDELKQSLKKANFLADLIEIRLDKLKTSFTSQDLKEIEHQTSCPIIWTLRHTSQGGAFAGTEKEQFEVLKCILSSFTPAWMDLESSMSKQYIDELQSLSPSTQWIISWHHQKETPVDLEKIYQQLIQYRATYYKMAAFAQTATDALRMLNFSRAKNQFGQKLCGICMGDRGQITRILSPVVNQPLTYACLDNHKATAPGQLTALDLLQIYRFRSLNMQTQILGLIGNPIDKSNSHLTHNAVFKKLALNAVYVKFHVEEKEFDSFFKEIHVLPIQGLSVTMPFKEKALSLLGDSSNLIACNTLKWVSGKIEGFNTDGVGALKALNILKFDNAKIMILGAGGTAKAIAAAAFEQGAQLIILNRSGDRAQAVAQSFNAKWGTLDQLENFNKENYQYVIQATSIGMYPEIDKTPISIDALKRGVTILDVIHHPNETKLLKDAKKKGFKIVSGRELFIHQAVMQFMHWFDACLPSQKVEDVIRQTLTQASSSKSVLVKKSHLKGEVKLPPSKSHSIRAILLAAMATGTSYLQHLLDSPDIQKAKLAATQFGANIKEIANGLEITGVEGNPRVPEMVIDVGNSGQVLRFAGALAALAEGFTVITGDESIRSHRSIQPLIDGLNGLQAWAVSTRDNGYAPLIVKGPMQAGSAYLNGKDSQPVSGLLMAAAFIDGQTDIYVEQAGETPWIALTLSWLDRLGVQYTHRHFDHLTVYGQKKRPAFNMTIPGDLSTLSFPIAAALITRSNLTIHHVDMQDIQGDKAFVFLLEKMGASFQIDQEQQTLKVLGHSQLKGQVIDVNPFIDAVPILAVLGCYAEGETRLINASIARQKESNRLACITLELKKMGADIEETEDGLVVRYSPLKGECVKSYHDHRMAMSLVIAGLGAEGITEVQDIECISKSYPHFIRDFIQLGAHLYESE